MRAFTPSDEIKRLCGRMCGEVKELQARSIQTRAEHHPHRQVQIRSPGGPVEVDEGMEPLLRSLWSLGVNTEMSCRDNMGSVWIYMSLDDFQRLHAIARANDDLAYFLDSCHYEMRSWTPEHFASECGLVQDDLQAQLRVSLRFPKQHMERLDAMLGALGPDLPPAAKRPRLAASVDAAAPPESEAIASLENELREERSTRSKMWREWNQERECVADMFVAFQNGELDAEAALDMIASDLGIASDNESEPGICEKCGVQQ
jgi:hypothetical protein